MSDYETTQRRRNLIVGFFVIAGLGALVWLIFKFGELPVVIGHFKSYQVSVQFPRAPGVEENTPVRFCGYQIGRVTDVQPPKVMEDLETGRVYHQTIIVLSIEKQYDKIPGDVDVKLMTRGLGSSYIELREQPFDANKPPEKYLEMGSVLQGSTGMTSEFFPEESQKKLDELIDGLKILIANANDIMGDKKSKEDIKNTLTNLSEGSKRLSELAAAGTDALKKADAKVDEVVTALVDTSKKIQKFADKGTSTVTKADRLVACVVEMSEEMTKATSQLRVILEKVDTGEGTAGRFLNDGKLYENMLESAEQMQMVLDELKLLIVDVRENGLRMKHGL